MLTLKNRNDRGQMKTGTDLFLVNAGQIDLISLNSACPYGQSAQFFSDVRNENEVRCFKSISVSNGVLDRLVRM